MKKHPHLHLISLKQDGDFLAHSAKKHQEMPENKAPALCYSEKNKKLRWRPKTTLPANLSNYMYMKILWNKTDLGTLQSTSQNKDEWFAFTTGIRKTAETATSDLASGRCCWFLTLELLPFFPTFNILREVVEIDLLYFFLISRNLVCTTTKPMES